MSTIYIPQRKGPMIYLPKHYKDRMADRQELASVGNCRKCSKPFSWRVSNLEQHNRPDNEHQDNRTRAMRLFLEYKSKGVGPCCANHEHRNFISRYSGAVIYY